MNILFFINSLNKGGAEKVLVTLVNKLAEKSDLKIDVMSIWGGPYKAEIASNVNVKTVIPEGKSIYRLYSKLVVAMIRFLPSNLLYRIFIKKKYDYEIAYLEGGATKIVSGSPNSNKYSFVHTNMQVLTYSTEYYLNLNEEIKAYRKFRKVFSVSSEVASAFNEKYGVESDVLMNAIDSDLIQRKSLEYIPYQKKGKVLVAVGRLFPVKGYDRLISVLNRINEKFSDWVLYIIGEGPEEAKLKQICIDYELEDKIIFTGFFSNPYPYIKNADLSICSSYTEGLSTFISESIILGVPFVSTECPGMLDILGGSNCGVLTENSEEGLYNGLMSVLLDDVKYAELKRNVLTRRSFFDIDARVNDFIDCIIK